MPIRMAPIEDTDGPGEEGMLSSPTGRAVLACLLLVGSVGLITTTMLDAGRRDSTLSTGR